MKEEGKEKREGGREVGKKGEVGGGRGLLVPVSLCVAGLGVVVGLVVMFAF